MASSLVRMTSRFFGFLLLGLWMASMVCQFSGLQVRWLCGPLTSWVSNGFMVLHRSLIPGIYHSL
ncbi:uncharacterized protein RHIMIDRAFT_236097 [Rhizopus microsporus ATCC 52813]|uniref:Uncharacterized protein n=1 Tax=Rhizopus microsporus ATCC 52813 TaxID=1340429 RepID=A0A2G4SZD3_RHIZD|nr:uncharacterized protein RHIMIDRAFT_236097 [Rhizopus microsporus ATCC 52813]PHZ14107.1 hypothetical protein RHIMIDRAFT_236097 [Rhizopus microsporus ATCC 52813]